MNIPEQGGDPRTEENVHSGLHWKSPSSRLVLRAVLDVLAERGYSGLTVDAVAVRAGAAAEALDEATDVDDLVVARSGRGRAVRRPPGNGIAGGGTCAPC